MKTRAAGLCHSDLSVIHDRPRPMPMVLGHEAAAFVPSCGHCRPCTTRVGRLPAGESVRQVVEIA